MEETGFWCADINSGKLKGTLTDMQESCFQKYCLYDKACRFSALQGIHPAGVI